MKFSMCNEFCEGMDLRATFRLAADCGYDGVEIAPFTLAETADGVTAGMREDLRRMASDHGLAIVGLHWLLVAPPGLHISGPDAAVRRRTCKHLTDLIRLCSDLGGSRMVFGSPRQRDVLPGDDPAAAWQRTVESVRSLMPAAEEHGVVLAFEPLSRAETNFINTKDEAVRLIEDVDHPNFRLILDTRAMSDEGRPIPDILHKGAPWLVHVHANDPNRRHPGSGALDFLPIMRTLDEIGYEDWISVEVFDFSPGAETIAREGLGYLRDCLERCS